MPQQHKVKLSKDAKEYLYLIIKTTLADMPIVDLAQLAHLLAGELEEVGLIEYCTPEIEEAVEDYIVLTK